MEQMLRRVDAELAHIRRESSSAIGSLAKDMQNQLKQSRRQIIARRAGAGRGRAQIHWLSWTVELMLATRHIQCDAHGGRGRHTDASLREAPFSADTADLTIVCAKAQAGVGRAHVHKCMPKFLARHTMVPPDAFKVTGPGAGRSFVLRFSGFGGTARQRADMAFAELCDGAGQWSELSIPIVSCGVTRLFVGKDWSKQQVVRDITGKRLVQVFPTKLFEDDICFRRSDGVLNRNRRPLAKARMGADGRPEWAWSKAELLAAGLDKQGVLSEMARQMPPSAEWSV